MPSRCRGGIAEERSNPQPMMNGSGEVGRGNIVCWAAPRSGGLESHWRSGRGRHIQKWG